MARFQYDKLSEHQLRIAIGLLNQESAVVEVLEEAAERKIAEALSALGLDSDVNLDGGHGGAAGGARAKVTKSVVGLNKAAAAPRKAAGRSRTGGTSNRATSGISPDQLASRQLQGRYLAAIRSVPKSKRGPYKALAKAGDREGAVKQIYQDYPRSNGDK